MKNLLLLLSICILIIVTCGCNQTPPPEEGVPVSLPQEESTPWDKIVQKNEIRIGVPTTATTFDNQLIDAFAKEAQLTVVKIPVLPEERAVVFQNDTVDMLWGQIPATSESSSMFRLSNPYFHSTTAYIARTEEFQPERQTPVGVVQYTAEAFMAEHFFEKVTYYQTENDLFFALSNRWVDCVLYNKPLYEKRNPAGCYVVKEVPCDLVVAFEHNNTSVATEVEKIIAKIKADGTASRICTQWYPQDFITK